MLILQNVLGPRITLTIGACGYSIYAGSLWAFDIHKNRGFVIGAGAILGFCAGLLWTAQGAIMMSYPSEKDKGRAFSVFWGIFTSGGVVGSAIALGMSYDNPDSNKTPTSVYIVFVILMLCAIGVVWFILPSNYVVRGDGSLVELQTSMKFKEELTAFAQQFKDWRMLLLFPMFFCSNYFYSYQGSIVSYMFNGRTRALSSLLSNLGAVIGAAIIGCIFDYSPGGRRQRAIIGWTFTMLAMCGVWGGGIYHQKGWERAPIDHPEVGWHHDLKSSASSGPLALMFFYYCVDSFYQGLAYYTMSSLTNDPFKLARMAGYYKGVQSAGAAISFGMDAVHTSYMTEVIVSFVIMFASLPFCLIVLLKIKDTNYEDEAVIKVENLTEGDLHHVAIPKGHHTLDDHVEAEKGTIVQNEDVRDLKQSASR